MHVSIFSSSLKCASCRQPTYLVLRVKMLSSNDNCNHNDLVAYTDQSIFHRPFFNDTNQINSKDHFPSSFIHYHELELEDHNFFLKQLYYDHLLLQHHEPVTLDDSIVPEIVVDMVDTSNKSSTKGLAEECNKSVICNKKMPSNKRSSSKKDRHSKINTAKGPRDRRMRLSLEVARKFFDLQDMLGHDKASKTVEWLLIQAKPEIKKLERCLDPEVNYCSGVGTKSTSEDEVEAHVLAMDKAAAIRGKVSSVKEKKIKHWRKAIRPLAKDLREKARARARERTSKKMWNRKFVDPQSKLPAQTQNKNQSLEVLVVVDQEPSSHEQPVNLGNQEEEIVDDALKIMEKWSPSSVSNYFQNIEISPEHQFADFQYFGNP